MGLIRSLNPWAGRSNTGRIGLMLRPRDPTFIAAGWASDGPETIGPRKVITSRRSVLDHESTHLKATSLPHPTIMGNAVLLFLGGSLSLVSPFPPPVAVLAQRRRLRRSPSSVPAYFPSPQTQGTRAIGRRAPSRVPPSRLFPRETYLYSWSGTASDSSPGQDFPSLHPPFS